MNEEPSPNGDNGRDARGRFAKGNPGGPGNPFARRVAALRRTILDAVTEDDLTAVVSALIERAKGGDVAAARELFDRIVGRAPTFEALEIEARLDELEKTLGRAQSDGYPRPRFTA